MNSKDALNTEWIVDECRINDDFMTILVHDKYGYKDALVIPIGDLISPFDDEDVVLYEL